MMAMMMAAEAGVLLLAGSHASCPVHTTFFPAYSAWVCGVDDAHFGGRAGALLLLRPLCSSARTP